MTTIKGFSGFFLVLALFFTWNTASLLASDHDDGEVDVKSRAHSLTDLYAFREDSQDSNGSPGNLILIMNTNPRSLARQQYFFSTKARYEFKLTRVKLADKSKQPTGKEDITLRFTFRAPNANGRQKFTFTVLKGGTLALRGDGETTSLAEATPPPPATGNLVINSFLSDQIKVFVGLREDPFFFDVERYFRIRHSLAGGLSTLGTGPTQSAANPFRTDATAVDFAAGYNVNSIVVKVPITYLQSAGEPIFDVWETISVPKDAASLFRIRPGALADYQQIERLGRPAINEGLVISNDNLKAFNSIPPSLDGSPAAKPVRDEAVAVLTAVYNYGISKGLAPPTVTNVATGFLPDVLRIDTTNKINIGTWAYNGDFTVVSGSSAVMLTGGRKLEDDVMDITLSYLLTNTAACGPSSACTIKDGVSYAGGTSNCTAIGTNPANPGHKCLYGQSTRNSSATFPFLADPN